METASKILYMVVQKPKCEVIFNEPNTISDVSHHYLMQVLVHNDLESFLEQYIIYCNAFSAAEIFNLMIPLFQ